MSTLAQFVAAKLPIIAGAGILGVSLVGACAALIGVSLTMGAEVVSAVLGMSAAGLVVAKQPPR